MPDSTAVSMPSPEVTPVAGPALSATTDMPVINVADDGKGIETEAPATTDAPADETKAADAEDAEGKTRNDKRVPVGEVTKERNRRREAEARATEAQERLDKALAALEAAAPKPQALQRPTRDQFSDPDAYDAALIRYAAEQAKADTVREMTAKQQADAAQATKAKLIADWETKKTEFAKDHADYAEVAESDVTITLPMSHAILTSENGPALAYWLGQNADEAARIATLPQVAQIRELGRIEARITAPAPTRAAKPAPIAPLSGTGSAGRGQPSYADLENMSMAEYAAYASARDKGGGSLTH